MVTVYNYTPLALVFKISASFKQIVFLAWFNSLSKQLLFL